MFQFRRFPTYAYLIQRRLTEYCSAGFPHSEISGSTVICTSPKLIAACHVLHRLLMPRHSPCALLRLTLLSCEQESKQRKLSWTTTLRQCLLLPLLSYSPLYKERSRSGSQAFELCRLRVLRNCLCYPFRKVPQIIFVSLCCLLFILGYFVQFSRCVSSFFRNQIQTLNLPECLHPISHYLTGTRPRRDAGSPAHKRFGEAKTLPQGQFICPEDVPSPFGAPHLMAIKWGGGPKWTRTTDLTIISRAL